MRLTLVRHGATAWNAQARYQGWTDIPLADDGIQQARALREYFSQYDIVEVISSDLVRCLETARIGFPNHVIRVIPEFRELSFGVWEGLTYQECLIQDPVGYQQWLDNPTLMTPPKGEALATFEGRIRQAIDTLLLKYESRADDHVVIVTHGGPIRFMLRHLLALNRIMPDFRAENIPHLKPCGYIHLDLLHDENSLITTG